MCSSSLQLAPESGDLSQHCKPIPVMKTVPCVVFLTGKNLFSSPGNPVMKTGFSVCGNTTQGKPRCGPVLALYKIAVKLRRV